MSDNNDEARRMVEDARAYRAANSAPASEVKPGDVPPTVVEAAPGERPGERDEDVPYKHELGAQVILTGPARSAARGATHGEIARNVMARDGAIAAGHVAHSSMPDMDMKPPQHAVSAALGEDPEQMTVAEAERQLEIAREREASMKERADASNKETEASAKKRAEIDA